VELEACGEFDAVVVNDDLEQALAELETRIGLPASESAPQALLQTNS
jgi:guanylate kinase